MARKRIYEIAKELGVTNKELIAKLDEMGMPDMKASNSVDEEEHALIVHFHQDEATPEPAAQEPAAEGAAVPDEKPAPVRKKRPSHGDPRPPVVSVLGHIDHGKTTLLDAIRESHLAEGEAGGITQGIAAYQADLGGRRITFVDTPGHKAFTGMRARGAQVTDIAILVVAADDGVMAQTAEAIDHIKAAGVPMIVAINKIDKSNADLPKVMNDLAQRGLTPETWGGETITVEVSALQNQNIEDLLEMILLVADMEDLRGDPNGPIDAVVIESHISPGRGPVATAIVKDGTLREKDWIVAGSTYGRVKALLDGARNRVSEAKPGDAVEILGFSDVPPVGTEIVVAESQTAARRAVVGTAGETRTRQAPRPMTLEDFFGEAEEVHKVQLILKAATTGALEAARREIAGLEPESVEIDVLLTGVGPISESDVILASTVTDGCPVIGFGVKADAKASRLAEREGVSVLTYDVIYDLIAELEKILKRALGPTYVESQLGVAEVRDTFKVPTGIVAGCAVVDGRIARSGKIRVVRADEEVFVGEIASLRRFEDDVREVESGRECGIRIRDFDDVQVGDRLVVFQLDEVEP
ncbi:MAG: translation initiation factor IF-2 [Candidatus Bipolaricaulia bacterium]